MSTTATETLVQRTGSLVLTPNSAGTASAQSAEQVISQEDRYKYDHLLPQSDPNLQLPPLEPFEHVDPGSRVPDPLNNPLSELLADSTRNVEMTPSIGTELEGVQLSRLDARQRDQLAVLVARRKVVVLRNQDCADHRIDQQLEFGQYFGRLHIHPTSAHPAGEYVWEPKGAPASHPCRDFADWSAWRHN
jgi:sulfonate dioxygenase